MDVSKEDRGMGKQRNLLRILAAIAEKKQSGAPEAFKKPFSFGAVRMGLFIWFETRFSGSPNLLVIGISLSAVMVCG